MGNKPISPGWIIGLTVSAIVMPIALCVVSGAGALLSAMGDSAGAMVLGRIALGGGILWVVALVCLVLAMAANTILRDEDEAP